MWWLAHGEHELPANTAWLSPCGQSLLAGIRCTKRHVEFRTCRFTAKRALAAADAREEAANLI